MKKAFSYCLSLVVFAACSHQLTRAPSSSLEIEFRKLPGLSELSDQRVQKYLGMSRMEYEQKVNLELEGLSQLPDGELSGPLEFLTVYEMVQSPETGKLIRKEAKIPTLQGIIIYPHIPTNGYDNFIPGGGVNGKEMLLVDFRQIPKGTPLQVRGKKVFLYSELSPDGRIYGESLMVHEAIIHGQRHVLTDKFNGPLKKNKIQTDNPNDLFVLIGTVHPDRWHKPLEFFMDRTIRIHIKDDLKKRQLLTAWFHPDTKSKKRIIAYSALVEPGNSWDPNWSFNLDNIEFHRPLTQFPEFCDGSLGQIEASYRSYRHHKISPLDHFCPWGKANEIVEIQDHRGQTLSATELKNRLKALGGFHSDFVR